MRNITLLNIDCMKYMAKLPDKAFDLAIVDPPFGLRDLSKNPLRASRGFETTYKNDSIPPPSYFKELYRVSKRSIIFGSQYFLEHLQPGGSFIVWDKGADPDKQHMSSCDVFWYSERQRIRIFQGLWCGACKFESRKTTHIHERPVGLYSWLLKHYAKAGVRILDTHLGSGSSAISAYYFGCDFVGCELDKDYYINLVERFNEETKQKDIFQAY